MPTRSSRRAIKPFVSLPRHRRRNAVIKLQGRMLRNISTTGSAMFDSHQLLMDPDERQREHEWVDSLVYEPRWTSHLIPRKRPGETRMYRMAFAPEQRYDVLSGQTYHEACDALETQLMQTLPMPPERFEIDRGYAYGIGLHAVVNVPSLDTTAIERTIMRFRALGERNWQAGTD
jgi:hypothetical protein